MVYEPITAEDVLAGAPILQKLVRRTRDNPLAVATALPSVPLSSIVNLGLALRTAHMVTTDVLKANGAGGVMWSPAPTILLEERLSGGGTWVVPAGVTAIEVLAIGGGSGSAYQPQIREGGSGATVRAFLPLVPGETLTWSIGTGGPGGFSGGSGGTDTFIRNAASTVEARAGGGPTAGTGVTAGGVAATTGALGTPVRRDGRSSNLPGVTPGGAYALAVMSWKLSSSPSLLDYYGRSGAANNGTANAGLGGYLRWRYIRP